MKKIVYFRSYLFELFVGSEIFGTKFIEKIKTNVLCPVDFDWNWCRFLDNVEKSYRAGRAADENTTWRTNMYINRQDAQNSCD